MGDLDNTALCDVTSSEAIDVENAKRGHCWACHFSVGGDEFGGCLTELFGIDQELNADVFGMAEGLRCRKGPGMGQHRYPTAPLDSFGARRRILDGPASDSS